MFLSVMVFSSDIVGLIFSLLKSLAPVITSLINFVKIRDSYYFFCLFIDYSYIDIPEKRRIQNTLVQKLMENIWEVVILWFELFFLEYKYDLRNVNKVLHVANKQKKTFVSRIRSGTWDHLVPKLRNSSENFETVSQRGFAF